MIGAIAKAIFGSSNDRYVKSLDKIVRQINAFEPTIEALTDEELAAQTAKFRRQLDEGKSLDQILPEAFATVREAGKRRMGMRHFDVQMIGGIVLHRGEIAEMRTGEGKTLVATLAVYLNALEGKAHLGGVADEVDDRLVHTRPLASDLLHQEVPVVGRPHDVQTTLIASEMDKVGGQRRVLLKLQVLEQRGDHACASCDVEVREMGPRGHVPLRFPAQVASIME